MVQREARILVADDEVEVAERLAELIGEAESVEVVGPAADGVEALELFERARPGCAVLDLSMPGKNGLELTREIRRTGHDCLIIILTQHAEQGIREACLRAGADHFLDKSREFERLPGIIAAFVEGTLR